MAKLVLTDIQVASVVTEVAPLVSSITSWDLALPSMRTRLLPREQGYEEIVEARLRLLELQVPAKDLVARAVEVLVKNNILAAYEPLSGYIMVVRENVDNSNLDSLKLVLGHELTHRTQHVHHPALLASTAIKSMTATSAVKLLARIKIAA